MSYASTRWTLLAVLCYSAPAIGQIVGRFYLEKNTFALGEPVFLNFEVSNSGREPEDIIRADPYSFCAGYEIHLSSDPSPTSTCPLLPAAGFCASSSVTVEPGARNNERILINYEHQIVEPGNFVVEASGRLPYGPGGGQLPLRSTEEFHGRLHFFVDGKAKLDSGQLKNWVDQLQSVDIAKRGEAARTLASLAPPSLESTLLGFVEDGRFTSWAPLAMHRLNTPRSIAALAAILQRTQPGTPENIESAHFLASSGDPRWFPLLLALAQKHRSDGGYLYPAAISGGDRAVQFLVELMNSGTGPRATSGNQCPRIHRVTCCRSRPSGAAEEFGPEHLGACALWITAANSSNLDRGERSAGIAVLDLVGVVVTLWHQRSHIQNNRLRRIHPVRAKIGTASSLGSSRREKRRFISLTT